MTYFNSMPLNISRGLLGLLFVMANTTIIEAAPKPMIGFSESTKAKEYLLEKKYDSFLSLENIRTRLIKMSSAPNYVGAPHNKENAEYTLKLFKKWGWDANIETFQALVPMPQEQILETIEPNSYQATFVEPPLKEDATSQNTIDVLPAYLAYSADGDVTSEIVYVNYGMPEDYETLARLGVSVKDKIVIVRYGAGWRGLKPKLAYENGAIGCIIYSDPIDDGYGQGDVYPKGAWRPGNSIQRGSVIDLPIAPGDPLTPNVGATEDAPRLSLEDVTTITNIPAVAISYNDAKHFLSLIDGQAVPESWRGGLPITYHIGPSTAKVHLKVKFDWILQPLYNVIAKITGEEMPNQWVIRGNNRDAWVYGAWVPMAAHSSMLEEAKAIGKLAQTGWRPKRTIVYASWDGEEMGLFGSTEWAETHADELKKKAVLYINTGINGRGFLAVDGSQPVRRLIDQVASDVIDPQTNVSVRKRAFASIQTQNYADGALTESNNQPQQTDFMIGDLGAGSDYTPFIQHLGIMSIDLGFGGEDEQAGIYHSAYDTYEHFERFGDPDMTYNVALAKTTGRLVLRTANADTLPFQYSNFANKLNLYISELEQKIDSMRTHTKIHNRLVLEDSFLLAADPKKKRPLPQLKEFLSFIDLSELKNVAGKIQTAAKAYDLALSKRPSLSSQENTELNQILQQIEQSLIDPVGLPGRPWYKHLIYAPGLLTGYAPKTIPGIREAVEGHRLKEANEYLNRTTHVLKNFLQHLEKATELISP